MSNITIIQADAQTWLKETSLTSTRYDCIITDPPWWTLDKWRSIGTTTRLGGHRDPSKRREDMWFPTLGQPQMRDIFHNLIQLMSKNSHAYIFADQQAMPIILTWARESEPTGAVSYSKPLVWDKIDAGMGYHWRSRAEYIIMLERGKRRLHNLSLPDVLSFKRVQGNHYPTEKPLALVETLLLNSTSEGEHLLDCFCGSGVVGEACLRHNRHATLLDINPEAIRCTKERLANVPISS